ncbi:hypothetical protein H5T87_10180 [bacterium]|nr:hypothetical protein [bacterium]
MTIFVENAFSQRVLRHFHHPNETFFPSIYGIAARLAITLPSRHSEALP